MKKLLISDITSTAFLRLKSGSLTHLQAAYQEPLNFLARSIVRENSFSTSNCYILYGCELTGTYPGAITISAGAIYYNEEIYTVEAYSGTISGGNVPVLVTSVSYFTSAAADPVTFTDGVTHNVHEIKNLAFTDDTTGSGIADYSQLLNILRSHPKRTTFIQTSTPTLTITFDGNKFLQSSTASGGASGVTFAYDFTNAVVGATTYVQVQGTGGGFTMTLPTAGATTFETLITAGYVSQPTFTITKNTVLKFTYLGRFFRDEVVLEVSTSNLP